MTDTREFRNLDQAADPSAMLRYLDSVSGAAGAQEYKRQSFELLEITPGQSVLDVGCGTGDDARMLAAVVGPTGRVVGVDLSKSAITEANRRSEGSTAPVEFRLGDAYELGFPADQFDAARADRIFQHLEDPARALQELLRVTRPDGRIVAADPDYGTLVVDSTDRTATEEILRSRFARNRWMGRQLRALFVRAGLVDVEVRGVVVLFTSLSPADDIMGLTRSAREAVDAGRVSASQASEWFDRLRDADRAGTFLASANAYVAGGRKPRA